VPPGAPAGSSDYQRIPLAAIRPNPFQPRHEFKDADLAELEASIKASGLLQPITVRPAGGGYELISGERRFRAATRLGWTEIPAVVRPADDRTMLTLALIENLQRADLNVVEEARGYQRLQEEFQLSQQEIAQLVGKERSTVANTLRLLTLPDAVLRMLEQGHLSMGHARALLGVSDHRSLSTLATEAAARQLSVREVERRVRELSTPQAKQAPGRRRGGPAEQLGSTAASAHVRKIEGDLRKRLQTDVKIQLAGPERGQLQIAFYSADDLDRLLELILGGRLQEPEEQM
jgi:ParB family chromosome partitioning protein